MEIKRGIPVSPGVAIGPAMVLDTEWFRIPRRFIETSILDQELERLNQAIAAAAQEAQDNQKVVSDKLGRQYGAVFGAHAQMITDPTLKTEIEQLVRKENHSPEYAVSRVMRRGLVG